MNAKYEQALYCQGYLAGYQKALMDYHILPKDSHIPVDIATLPIDQLGLSARAVNCLHAAGCRCIADVCGLDLFRIQRMRNLGPKTAAEIAGLIVGYGIHHTAWSQFLQVEKSSG